MIYSRYGISFHLLKEHHIEMVRQWRNDPVVANNYEYREHITPEMQLKWFRSVSNINNLYTVIDFKGEKVGVINIKNIDWENKTCEGGIFIPYPKFHQSFLPAIISYITTEIIFIMFDWNIAYAHVLKENKQNQAFVRQLGYELSAGQENEPNQEWTMTRETFDKKAPKLKKAIAALAGNNDPGMLLIEKEEFSDELVLAWESIVKSSPGISRCVAEPEGRKYYFG